MKCRGFSREILNKSAITPAAVALPPAPEPDKFRDPIISVSTSNPFLTFFRFEKYESFLTKAGLDLINTFPFSLEADAICLIENPIDSAA